MSFICLQCRQAWRQARNLGRKPTGTDGKKRWRNRYSTTPSRPPRVGIIGSGPAGFYSAHRLQQRLPETKIDMYEMLPTPFGLVRFGVAPDHPEVKNCIDTFTQVAEHPNFTYVGNTSIGEDPESLSLGLLAQHYDALLFAYGASKDKRLGVPGEGLAGVLSARAFVGWYNGLPEYADLNPDLSKSSTPVIIGQGNVAMDVARMLLRDISEIEKMPDVTEEAIEVFRRSKVENVRIVGRRGPLQAAFTTKELRELIQLPHAAVQPPQHSGLPEKFFTKKLEQLPRLARRSARLMLQDPPKLDEAEIHRTWMLEFMLNPTKFIESNEIEGGQASGTLAAIAFQQMRFKQDLSEIDLSEVSAIKSMKVEPDPDVGDIKMSTNLAFRSVGYKSAPLQGMDKVDIPFDEQLGIIPNDMYGRIMSPQEGPGSLTAGQLPGMYTAGWVKRGPTGVIATTMDDAFISADVILQDWSNGVRFLGGAPGGSERRGWPALKKAAEERGIRSISWEDWKKVDAAEIQRGKDSKYGPKVREKFRSVKDMLGVLD